MTTISILIVRMGLALVLNIGNLLTLIHLTFDAVGVHFILLFRCDGRIHCKDASDEDMCDKIVVPDSYLNEVPVPPLTNEPLAKILLEVEIISVQELIEVDAIMTLQYKLSFKWMDSRITFQNLKSFDFLNTVATYDAQKIWHPNVVFFNTRDMEQTKV